MHRVNMFAALAALAIAGISPAIAHADTQDDHYLANLASMGINPTPPEPFIQFAHGICDNPMAEPALKLGLVGQTGISLMQSMSAMTAAFRAYCPDKLSMLPPFLTQAS